MRVVKRFFLSAALGLGVSHTPLMADDTDIYLNSASAGGAPYLMLSLDYRSDMAATFCSSGVKNGSCTDSLSEHPELLKALQNFTGVNGEASNIHATLAVLEVVFAKFEGIYVGLMIPNDANGGTILRGYKLFEAGDSNGAKAELIDILNAMPLPTSGNDYHDTSPKETHYEWYSYVNGLPVISGDQTAGNFGGTTPPNPDYDPNIISGGNYISPFATNPSNFECTNLYEVYATSGNTSGSDNDLDSLISAAMGGATSYEEMVSFMRSNDVLTNVPGEQTLKTWFIQMGSSAAFTDDWAIAADTDDQYMNVGGKSADLFDVQTKLEAAFVEALSVSTTFVAASVPVNVFNRIQVLDDFYIALFEANATARWPGNLKKLKLSDSDLDGVPDTIVDALNQTAFSTVDGRIKYEALTFWTDPNTLPPADVNKNEVTDRDGRSVERGGAGQQIPGFVSGSIGDTTVSGARQLYLEPPSYNYLFDTFDATSTNATNWQTELGAATDAEALEIIKWARGQDADDDDGDGNFTEARSWLLGDAIHSRPLTINYGARGSYTQTNPDIRLMMGTNDGFFHMFKNTNADGTESGEETFAFAPRELMDNFKILKDNTSSDHIYGVDGEPVALVNDVNADGTIDYTAGDSAYVYFGLRRGGKSLYGINVSDPDNPYYLGKRSPTDVGFSELGYTFSTPRIGKVRFGGSDYDVLIFGAGYDTSKDSTATDPDGSRAPDTEGRAIYVTNARTGDVLWKVNYGAVTQAASNTEYNHASMLYSVPSDVATLDGNHNGIIDRVYVGDMGGNVWRLDLPEGNNSSDTNHRQNNWKATVLADLSDSADSEDVRFFHRPEVVQTKEGNSKYDAVVIASGDRANPLETVDTNYLYVIRDNNVVSGTPPTTTIDDTDLADVTSCASPCTGLNFAKGWKLELTGSGEKGLSSPLVSAGKIFHTTYSPNTGSGNSCAPAEGSGKIYISNLSDGTEVFTNSRSIDIGPGIPASPIALSGDLVLLPGTGLDSLPSGLDISGNAQLLKFSNRSMWILYWHHTGNDNL